MDGSRKIDLRIGDIIEENGIRYQVTRVENRVTEFVQKAALPPAEEELAKERAWRTEWHDEDIGNGPNPAHQTRLITVGDVDIILYAGPDYWYVEVDANHPLTGLQKNMAESDAFADKLRVLLGGE